MSGNLKHFQKQLTLLPHRFHIDIPDELLKEVLKCKDNKAVRQVGVEWAIQQSKELVKQGAPCLHYYTMGNSDNVLQIAKSLF